MSISLEAGFSDCGWSEEYDCIPLRSRLKMLRHSKVSKSMYSEIRGDRKEDDNFFAERIHEAKESSAVVFGTISEFPNHHASDSGLQISYLDEGFGDSVRYPGRYELKPNSCISSIDTGRVPTFEARMEALGKESSEVGMVVCQTSTDVAQIVQQECSKNSEKAAVEAANGKQDFLYGFDEDLDDLVLGERRKILLSRKLVKLSRSCMLETNEESSSKDMRQCADIENQDSAVVQDTPMANSISLSQNTHDHPNKANCSDRTSYKNRPHLLEMITGDANVDANTVCDAMTSSVLLSHKKVKDEPVDATELCTDSMNCIESFLSVKTGPAFSDSFGDELDHLPLIDRLNMLSSGGVNIEVPNNLKSLKDDVDGCADDFETLESISFSRPLKRRKTATNSIETALEEDAPGLLKVLIERGVLVEEIKLYGEEEPDGDLDDSLSDDGFAELEAVISQLYSQRQTFLKFPLLRSKGGKICYYLACLLSLVDQTRYLLNRKWPVEWGWCRDLQSFIFVFHRHNRIVLERPEYGYATYFFELLNSVPVAWQIKRLVTAMKLTRCGRVTLIENKPLVVGEDLSEGEAQVLAEYGWTPNTGLGTMLNYCDRVVHDRKQVTDSSEWRSKIGKQLVNGYNGGNIVSKNLPKKLIEFQGSDDVQVKLEQ